MIAREEYDQLQGLAKQAKKGLEKYRTSHMEIIKRVAIKIVINTVLLIFLRISSEAL